MLAHFCFWALLVIPARGNDNKFECNIGVCIPENYKSNELPILANGTNRTTVMINLNKNSRLRKVDDNEMTIALDTVFWVAWEDHRLNITYLEEIMNKEWAMDKKFVHKLWLPKFWATNLKSSETKRFMSFEAMGMTGYTTLC